MMSSTSYDDWPPHRLCGPAAFALCIAHLLSVGALAYQAEGPHRWEQFLSGEWLNHEFAINYGFFCAPALVVFLSRRVCILVGLCAVPILVIFSVRMYCLYQFLSLGVNSLRPKGDSASWAMVLMGMAAVAIVAVWVLVRIFYLFSPPRGQH
jgi:hypothetical protein